MHFIASFNCFFFLEEIVYKFLVQILDAHDLIRRLLSTFVNLWDDYGCCLVFPSLSMEEYKKILLFAMPYSTCHIFYSYLSCILSKNALYSTISSFLRKNTLYSTLSRFLWKNALCSTLSCFL